MQNDVLKNSIAPWQEKGRWYHIQIESDGATWKINKDKSDSIFANASVSSNTFIVLFSSGYTFIPLDLKCVFTTASFGAFNAYTITLRYTSTRPSISVVGASEYRGIIDCYVFGY